MTTVICGLASLMVASLYYFWRAYHEALLHRERILRQRVAYMLWTAANTE